MGWRVPPMTTRVSKLARPLTGVGPGSLLAHDPARPPLADLLGPMDAATFYRTSWRGGAPFVSEPNVGLVEQVKSIEALASIHALLARHARDVTVFGPGGRRSSVPPKAALEALECGHNLYVTSVADTVP